MNGVSVVATIALEEAGAKVGENSPCDGEVGEYHIGSAGSALRIGKLVVGQAEESLAGSALRIGKLVVGQADECPARAVSVLMVAKERFGPPSIHVAIPVIGISIDG